MNIELCTNCNHNPIDDDYADAPTGVERLCNPCHQISDDTTFDIENEFLD